MESTHTPAPSVDPINSHGLLPGLAHNLLNGLKIALFLPVRVEKIPATPGDLALVALSDLALNLTASLLLVGRSGGLNYGALPSFLFHLPLMLLCGYLAGKALDEPRLVRALPTALIALSLPIELTHTVLEALAAHVPRLRWMEEHLGSPGHYRFFWWWCAAAAVFVGRMKGRWPRVAGALLLFFVLLVSPLWFFSRGDLWVGNENGESGELRVTEEVLDAQPQLLDQQLSDLMPADRSGPNLYWIGFAGDSTQDVFLKELMAYQKLFASRFGAAGRTIALANNPQSATRFPFATETNLARALTRVGEVMDRERDVLFLYLTSHGSKEHELSVNNGPLELSQVTPEDLKEMLQESGIKWKVLVISACYSGGFVEPLRDDHTVIITAADATHESFGCGNGEKFTWFGNAYFEALRRSYSFTKAFETARETIGKWESEQGETPSNPQIWIGKAMDAKLPQLEKRLTAKR